MTRLLERWWRRSNPHADVQVELTQLTFRKLAPTVGLGGLALVLSTILLARYYDDPALWTLAEVMSFVCGARLAVVIAFGLQKEANLTIASVVRWQWVYSVATLAYSLCMAATTLYNFRFHDHVAKNLCLPGVFMFCAGLSARFQVRPLVTQASGLIMLGALGFSVLRWESGLAWAEFLTICLFAYVHCEAVQVKFHIVVKQIRSRRTLRELADHDPLTGLANRRHFLDSVSKSCGDAEAFAILYIDLDRFKKVNDTYGHSAGDTLLREAAHRLQCASTERDLLARLGGDEFAILHRLTEDQGSAEMLAQRINEAIALPFTIGGRPVLIGASIGIRISEEGDRERHRMVNKADEAMYAAKQAGGGGFCFAAD